MGYSPGGWKESDTTEYLNSSRLYVNEVISGKHLRMGANCQRPNVIRGLKVAPPHSQGREEGLEIEFNHQ